MNIRLSNFQIPHQIGSVGLPHLGAFARDWMDLQTLTHGQFDPALANLRDQVGRYRAQFAAVVATAYQIGLDENADLQGKLRSAVHDIEEVLVSEKSDAPEALMLMMRRHEKDFLARVDGKYLAAMHEAVGQFSVRVAASDLTVSIDRAESRDEVGDIAKTAQVFRDNLARACEVEAKQAAVEEQGAATGEITRNVQQAAVETQEFANNIIRFSAANGETGAAAHRLLTAASKLSLQAHRMQRNIATFVAAVRAG